MRQTDRSSVPTFLSLPSTRIGRWSAVLLLVSLVLVVLNSALIMPTTESRAGLGTVQTVINVVIGSCVLAAGVCGLVALFIKRERSWTVFAASVLFFVILAMMAQDLATPGN